MPPTLYVYELPEQATPEELAGSVAVVIDVLRASTTIVHALEAGAREVVPVVEVDQAREIAEQFANDEILLGGERLGLPIDGFDLGNSPTDYTADRVARKTLVFTTSNGTRAMDRAQAAERILIGAFVNATAIVEELVDQEHIRLICAGSRGRIGTDDLLLAGLFVERLREHGGLVYEHNPQATAARDLWLDAFALPQALGGEPIPPEQLAEQLAQSAGGENLTALGLEADILTAAQIDYFRGVPELDPEKSRIRLV